MTEALPTFRYHPDPIATGAIEPSDEVCPACEQVRGFAYTATLYAEEEVEGVCPWCIADGTAAERFDAETTDVADAPDDIPADVLEVLATRTPGFEGWQQEHWRYHCGDAAAFLGRVGAVELEAQPTVREEVLDDLVDQGGDREGWDEHLGVLDRDGEATGYLFRCLACGRHLAYTDAS